MHLHWGEIFAASAGSVSIWSFLGHAVSTAPVPKSDWGKWVLSCIQWLVGQRLQALATAQRQSLPSIQEVRELPNGTDLKMEVK